MLPYYLLLFIPAVVPLIVYQPRKFGMPKKYSDIVKKRNKMMIILFFLGLFILMALRDISVGTDIETYKTIFDGCANVSFDYLSNLPWELGYTIYNKLVALVFNDYRFFLILTSFIILIPIYELYIEEKKYGYLLIVLFINMPCFLMMFSGLRQALATSIGVLAYMAIEKRKNILGMIFILLAMSFHSSAFVLFLIYPAFYLKIKTKHLLYVVPLIIVIYYYRVPIFTSLIGLLPSKYVTFYGELQQTGAFGMMVLFLVFTIFSFVVLDEKYISDRDYCMRNLLLIATIFQLFVPIHGLIQRASYYFLVFAPVSIISVVNAPRKRLKSISNVAVVVMGCFFTFYFFYTAYFSTDNLLDVFPYVFYWSGKGW